MTPVRTPTEGSTSPTYDVVVVGAGSAGSSAAITASRQGARTLLADRLAFMGGTSTAVLDTFYAFFTPGDRPRRVVGGLIAALPGMGSIVLLLLLVFYVFSVMATKLYGGSFPEWFGSIPSSAYSLFQIMTLESWSMGIVRPVMAQYPMAWAFFVPFIVATSFTVLNLFIGIIVSAMQAEHEQQASADREAMHGEQEVILDELRALRREIAELKAATLRN